MNEPRRPVHLDINRIGTGHTPLVEGVYGGDHDAVVTRGQGPDIDRVIGNRIARRTLPRHRRAIVTRADHAIDLNLGDISVRIGIATIEFYPPAQAR